MLPARIKTNSTKADEGKRSPAHRKWVRGFECSVPGCGQRPIECAHVRLGTDGGVGIKPADKWCISLCVFHHAEQHQIGEIQFEKVHRLDLKALAAEFFFRSPHRGNM